MYCTLAKHLIIFFFSLNHHFLFLLFFYFYKTEIPKRKDPQTLNVINDMFSLLFLLFLVWVDPLKNITNC
jgi:hypothetical protein